jgi:hypothetical protein
MSIIKDNEVLDFRFKRTSQKFRTLFYVGDIFVGQIFKMGRTYSVVGKNPHPLSPIRGLATRWQAAELLLRMEEIEEK